MNIEEKIKQRFKDYLNNSMRLNKAIRECKDQQINNYLKQRLKNQPEWQKISWLVIGIVKNIQLLKCHTCGKILPYSRIKNKSKYCSYECKFKNKDYLNYLKTVDHSKAQIQQKRKQTFLKKYGVENISQLEQIKKKKCQTQMKNFGVSYSFQSKELKQKSKQTMQQKYGVDHISQVEEIKNQKHIKRCKLEYKKLQKYKDYVIPLFTLEEYIEGKQKKWKCVKCGKEFIQNILYTTGHIKGLYWCPRCWNCYPQTFGQSHQEEQIFNYIKTFYNGQILRHDRSIITPKELDIVLPQLKIAIEFDGAYWHSIGLRVGKDYHKEKTEKCLQKGYRLIHIFDYEWIKKQQIIKQKLKSIICNNQKAIYARKCQIKQIDFQTSSQFLNNNHIQGEDRSPIRIGLYYQNELVAVMTFCKPRFNKKYQWELCRYATSKRVIGGAGKLLKYFKKNYKPKSIITYADRRFSVGNMYQKIGFKLDHISEPSFIFVSQNHQTILSRFDIWKKNMKKNFKDYKNEDNVQQFLINKRFNKLYDCGNLVYVMNKYIQI